MTDLSLPDARLSSALAWLLLTASATAGALPENGTYCRDGDRSMFSFKRDADGTIEFSALSSTANGDGVLSYYGHAKRVGDERWVSVSTSDDPENKCRVDIVHSGTNWSIGPEDASTCEGNHGAHGPYEMPPFPASSFVHPVVGPLANQDCRAPKVGADTDSDDPVAPVRAVIGMDEGGWGTLFAEKPTALMRQYFSQGFNRSWTNAMTHNQEGPVLDGDPITGWQSVSRVAVTRIFSVAGKAGTARVTAELKVTKEGQEKTEKVLFDIVRDDQHWKINDIKDPTMPSIRAYFRNSYGG